MEDELKKHEEQYHEIADSLMQTRRQWEEIAISIEQIDQLERSTRETLQTQEQQLSSLDEKEQTLVKTREATVQKRVETEKQIPQIEAAVARISSTTNELRQQREQRQKSDDELRSTVEQLRERQTQLQRIASDETLQQLLSSLHTMKQSSYPFEARRWINNSDCMEQLHEVHGAKEELQAKIQQIESQLRTMNDAVNVAVVLSVINRMRRMLFKKKKRDTLICSLDASHKWIELQGTKKLENHFRESYKTCTVRTGK